MRTRMKTITRAFCAMETAVLVTGTLLITSVCGDEKQITQSVPAAATSREASRETATVPLWDGNRLLNATFDDAHFGIVLSKFVKETGLRLENFMSEALRPPPSGTITLPKAENVTANQVLDSLNQHLFPFDFLLIRDDRILYLTPTNWDGFAQIVPQIALGELSTRAKYDLVRTAIPVQRIDPAVAEKQIRKVFGPLGRLTRLGTQFVVQDFAENLQSIQNVLVNLELPSHRGSASKPATEDRLPASSGEPLVDAAGNPIEVGDFDGDGVLDVRAMPIPTHQIVAGESITTIIYPMPNAARSILDALRRRSADTESETARRAAEYRQARDRLGANDAKVNELGSHLTALVQTAFDHRQQAQRLEAEILRQQLKHVDARLVERERLKGQIVNRRLQELLDPNLNWASEQGASRTLPTRDPAQDNSFSRLPQDTGSDAIEIAFAGEKREKAPTTSRTSKARTSYPRIVKSVPEAGATEVDPKLKEITVTFDRDMRGGMSWTGGPPWFPETDPTQKARWINPRTCVLPVIVTERQYYRVGINSTSFQNFKSADGTPTPPSAVWFTTRDAGDEVKDRVRRPEIASIEPANGATDVDPATAELRVTFTMPMGDGMSWTGSGPKYPASPSGSQATWSADGLTCTLSVTLAPGHEYELGLNSLNHINFQSRWGVPLEPVVYKFKTR